jgi:hypothetical protein
MTSSVRCWNGSAVQLDCSTKAGFLGVAMRWTITQAHVQHAPCRALVRRERQVAPAALAVIGLIIHSIRSGDKFAFHRFQDFLNGSLKPDELS